MERIIFETENKQYRIREIVDIDVDLDNLKGDCFNPKHILEMHDPSMTVEKLREEELEFEALVEREGVYGYVLEKWNPDPGIGYEHVDSCFGFVGQYSETETKFRHYIVDEMRSYIQNSELVRLA